MASIESCKTENHSQTDPVLAVALAWIEAHAATRAHCAQQQELETELMNDNRWPRAGDGNDPKHAQYETRISEAFANAVAAESVCAAREQALLDELARTKAVSLSGIAAKLSVVVQEAEDNTDLCDFPVAQVWSALGDLQHMMHRKNGGSSSVSVPGVWDDDQLSPGSASQAAWFAFLAWCRTDERRYRIWSSTFKALRDL